MSGTAVSSTLCEISDPDAILLSFLRSGLGLTGVKPGWDEGACGACAVLPDGPRAGVPVPGR